MRTAALRRDSASSRCALQIARFNLNVFLSPLILPILSFSRCSLFFVFFFVCSSRPPSDSEGAVTIFTDPSSARTCASFSAEEASFTNATAATSATMESICCVCGEG